MPRAPEPHLVCGGKKQAQGLRAVQLHQSCSLSLGLYNGSYTSENAAVPLAITTAGYKGGQTANFKGEKAVTSVN